jgi:hypothetical protein
MTVQQITADALIHGDRLNVAGAEFTVLHRVHGAWYLDCPGARFVEFELEPVDATSHAVASTVRLPKQTTVTVDRPGG